MISLTIGRGPVQHSTSHLYGNPVVALHPAVEGRPVIRHGTAMTSICRVLSNRFSKPASLSRGAACAPPFLHDSQV